MGEVDEYERVAEFHELFMAEAWDVVAPTMHQAFAGLTASDVIVDIGAGSGLGVQVLAGCTAARILAVEPSMTMRAMLTARVSQSADLVDRVTVVAGRAPHVLAGIGTTVAGFVCAHVLGHIDRADRLATFDRLAGMLDGRGVGVITFAPDDDEPTHLRTEASTRLGEHRYVERHEQAPWGGYCTEYEVWRDDTVVRTERVTGHWERITAAQVRAELGTAGLRVRQVGSGVGLVAADPCGSGYRR